MTLTLVERLPKKFLHVTEVLEAEGAEVFVSGGVVHDALWHKKYPFDLRPIKDLDIEVFGLSFEDLGELLKQHGRIKQTGQEFPVYDTHMFGVDTQFALPRRERKMTAEERKVAEARLGKTLSDHHAFVIEPAPNMSVEEACKRRITDAKSALYRVSQKKLVDPYGAWDAINSSLFDVVSETSFPEDPVRVLICASYMTRYLAMNPTERLVDLAKAVSDRFPFLTAERVWTEFYKMFKYYKPSRGLEFLHQVDWLKHFPEIDAMRGVPQDPSWHPEGELWIHTKLAGDYAAHVCRQYYDEDDWKLPASQLCGTVHDVGKPDKTTHDEDGHIRSRDHQNHGVKLASVLLKRLKAPDRVREFVCEGIREHMLPIMTPTNARLGRMIVRFYRRNNYLTLRDLDVIVRADTAARPPLVPDTDWDWTRFLTKEQEMEAAKMSPKASSPVTGKMVMDALHIAPGPMVGQVKAVTEEAFADGQFELENVAQWMRQYVADNMEQKENV